jgi:antitoxin PrlF
MASTASNPTLTVEATVSSKGQITLPKELRKRLGLQQGSKVRFNIPAKGAVKIEPVLNELEDLWAMADAQGRTGGVMSFEEMDAAKARRQW